MMQPTFLQGVATPPSQMPPKLLEKRSSMVEFNTAALPIPSQVTAVTPTDSPRRWPSQLPTHDWGYFGEYEYLGPGTPYTQKIEAGIQPRNDLDAIAQMHDSQYSWTAQHTVPGTGLITSGIRGVADYGAGAAMVNASINPWSDLTMKDRVLAFGAGQGLMFQGILRLSPPTMLGAWMLDKILY